MKTNDATRDNVVRYIIGGLVTLLGGGLAKLGRGVWEPIAKHVLPAIDVQILLLVCGVLAIGNVVTLWMLLTRGDNEERVKNRLQFHSLSGVFRDPKTGISYCPRCHGKGLVVPMRESRVNADGKLLVFCQQAGCGYSFSGNAAIAGKE